MTDRPILFSAPMVRALLAGTKTQTRRVVRNVSPNTAKVLPDTCPYGQPGDRLWVRETFAPRYFDDGRPGYRADWTTLAADYVTEPKWKPSIFMRRAESRITLDVTDVRVERVQAISEVDAKAEGAESDIVESWFTAVGTSDPYAVASSTVYRSGYRELWDSINSKRPGCSWADNPWVWCVSFKRVTP